MGQTGEPGVWLGNRRSKPKILVADRDGLDHFLIGGFLAEEYQLKLAPDAAELIALLAESRDFDALILDAEFDNALGLLARIREEADWGRLPILFSASFLDQKSVERAIELGASDFISKPYLPGILKLRIDTQIELSRSKAELQQLVERRTQELEDSRIELVRRLARAAESRDNETGMHIVRMAKYSQAIALAAGASAAKAEMVLNAAPMHDIGKIGVPDHVLLKPGPLDEHEWKSMREHCRIGATIIGKADSELTRSASAAALSHHERYDGTGYPNRLSGEAIPWIGRVLAIADVFDALTSIRPYKRAWPTDLALDLIRSESGSHFDPELVDAFFLVHDEIAEIQALFQD